MRSRQVETKRGLLVDFKSRKKSRSRVRPTDRTTKYLGKESKVNVLDFPFCILLEPRETGL